MRKPGWYIVTSSLGTEMVRWDGQFWHKPTAFYLLEELSPDSEVKEMLFSDLQGFHDD
jgi:hypothetical protein